MGAITIEWPSNTELVLPECFITIPEGLEGNLMVYTVPEANDIGVKYQAFLNIGEFEQRPACACEKFKLICKYDFSTIADNSIEMIYLLEGIVPTITLNVIVED